MKMRKKLAISITAILLIIAAFLLYDLWSVQNYQAAVKNIQFSNIDISTIPDGRYTGECNVDLISAKVEVLIQNGRITSIDLLQHKNDRGKPAETIIHEMISKQTTDVDAISGVTNSSKVIRKAVENALLANE